MSSDASSQFQSTFRLPVSEPLIESYNCAFKKGALLYQGRMYFSPHWCCFRSTILDLGHIMMEGLAIDRVELEKLFYFIPNSIRITMKDGKQYFFTSFIHRQAAYEKLIAIQQGRQIFPDSEAASASAPAADPAASVTLSPGAIDKANLMSKKERLLIANAKRIKEEKMREEKAALEALKAPPVDDSSETDDVESGEEETKLPWMNRDQAVINSLEKVELASKGAVDESLVKRLDAIKLSRQAETDEEEEERTKEKEKKKKKKKDKEQDKPSKGSKSPSPGPEDDEGKAPKHSRSASSSVNLPSASAASRQTTAAAAGADKTTGPRSSSSSPRGKAPSQPQSSSSGVADSKFDDQKFPGIHVYDHITYRLPDEKVTKINDRFINLENRLDTRNRRYLMEGEMKRQGRWTVVDRLVFLLTDVLLITKPLDKSGDKLQMKQIVQLDAMIIDARPIAFQRSECRDTKLPAPFRLIQMKPEPESYIFSAPSLQLRKKWIAAISLAVTRLQWARNHAACQNFGWHLKNNWGSMHWAALNNNQQIIDALINEDPECIEDRDQEGSSVLHIAVQANHSELIPFLLHHGADLHARDAEGKTALMAAAKLGLANCVQELLNAHGTDVEDFHPVGDRKADKAAKAKKSDPKKPKISTGFNSGVNLRERSALWLCAIHHSLQFEKCLRLLTQFAANELDRRFGESTMAWQSVLDDRDENGVSLLEVCVALNQPEVVEVLIGCGANVNSINSEGVSPLGLAAQQGNMEMLIALIQNGAQPNLRPTTGMNTPLHFASSLEVASYLVANGARMGLKSSDGDRITDIFSSSAQVSTLRAAESLNINRAALNCSTLAIESAPDSTAANGGHTLDSCFICQDGIILNLKKREWCRCCGRLICSSCAIHKLIFLVEKSQKSSSSSKRDSTEPVEGMEGRVCDGCFNRWNYKPQTEENKKKRKLRVKEEWTSLSKIGEFITAVRIESDAVPAFIKGISTPFQPFGMMELEEKPEEIRFKKSKKKEKEKEKAKEEKEKSEAKEGKETEKNRDRIMSDAVSSMVRSSSAPQSLSDQLEGAKSPSRLRVPSEAHEKRAKTPDRTDSGRKASASTVESSASRDGADDEEEGKKAKKKKKKKLDITIEEEPEETIEETGESQQKSSRDKDKASKMAGPPGGIASPRRKAVEEDEDIADDEEIKKAKKKKEKKEKKDK